MSPEYLRELADWVDPEKLWRLSGIDQRELSPEQRKQLDAGVALRRHARHVQTLLELLPLRKSLVITPLSPSSSASMTIDPPGWHKDSLENRLRRVKGK